MRLINQITQLTANIETLENYLVAGTEEEQETVRKLIRRGKSLVAYKIDGKWRFTPSRFVGYVNNNLVKHERSTTKDGTKTNPTLNNVIGLKLSASSMLESEYIKYCRSLGEEPSNYSKRRYWSLNVEEDFDQNQATDEGFPEGKVVERIHRKHERSRTLVNAAKKAFKDEHGKLFCQVCELDFEERYGKVGRDFIEGHHTIPVSEMKPGHKSSPEDIAMLCSNCHRMVHRRRPWLSMDELSKLIR
jgi:predicted HNH restriction endonuclease